MCRLTLTDNGTSPRYTPPRHRTALSSVSPKLTTQRLFLLTDSPTGPASVLSSVISIHVCGSTSTACSHSPTIDGWLTWRRMRVCSRVTMRNSVWPWPWKNSTNPSGICGLMANSNCSSKQKTDFITLNYEIFITKNILYFLFVINTNHLKLVGMLLSLVLLNSYPNLIVLISRRKDVDSPNWKHIN